MKILSLDLTLTENNSVVSKKILDALLPDLNKYLDKALEIIKNKIPIIIIESIKQQPEYDSLINGKLKAEFGLPDAESRVSSILSHIQNSIIVESKPVKIIGSRVGGSVAVKMIPKDFADLLALGESTFTTEKGSNLEWLRWLLTQGDTIIISNYDFFLGAYANSRTGMGIMKSGENYVWRVPPEFAGTVNNNWITRAITSASSLIEQQIKSLERI